ncbi:unnamed protein product [Rotaria socialis]|uniref:Uncharacterized protein n=1 Tax=Rotaria socialis TaxID=392032 RepID=A0A818UNV1_9BILA|nr:unnamed protein product [Rotaria socialis]
MGLKLQLLRKKDISEELLQRMIRLANHKGILFTGLIGELKLAGYYLPNSFDELHDAVHMAFEDLGGSNQLIYKLDLLLPSPLINYNQPQIK